MEGFRCLDEISRARKKYREVSVKETNKENWNLWCWDDGETFNFRAYAVDQKVKFVDSVDCIYKPDDIFPKVDAVVITVLSDVEEIIEKIDERIDGEIILLEKMIMDIVENI